MFNKIKSHVSIFLILASLASPVSATTSEPSMLEKFKQTVSDWVKPITVTTMAGLGTYWAYKVYVARKIAAAVTRSRPLPPPPTDPLTDPRKPPRPLFGNPGTSFDCSQAHAALHAAYRSRVMGAATGALQPTEAVRSQARENPQDIRQYMVGLGRELTDAELSQVLSVPIPATFVALRRAQFRFVYALLLHENNLQRSNTFRRSPEELIEMATEFFTRVGFEPEQLPYALAAARVLHLSGRHWRNMNWNRLQSLMASLVTEGSDGNRLAIQMLMNQNTIMGALEARTPLNLRIRGQVHQLFSACLNDSR